MKMFKIFLVALLGSLAFVTVTYSGQESEQPNRLLDRPAKHANLEHVMVGQAAVNALLDADAPGGVAKLSDCNDPTFSFKPQDYSLRGVLDSIVSSDPRYMWEIKDGVVNVVPDKRLPSFLAVRISKFEISDVESLREVLSLLLSLPEVREAQRSLGSQAVQGGSYAFCPGGCSPKEKRISISLKDVTVREALNAIARTHGNAVWWFRPSECRGRKFFSLDFAAK